LRVNNSRVSLVNFLSAASGKFGSDAGVQPPDITSALDQFFAATTESNFETVDYLYASLIRQLQKSRLLIPLVSESATSDELTQGIQGKANQVLSVAYVEGPDGRTVAPVFTSVTAMALWNDRARPVPFDASKVALAMASEGISLMALDPGSEKSLVLRRGSVRALATGEKFQAPSQDSEILDAILEVLKPQLDLVVTHSVRAGDPTRQLLGPEIVVSLTLVPGLTASQLGKITQQLSEALYENLVLQEKVDGLGLKVLPA